MAFQNHKNFSYSLVATAPSPATSGTSLVVSAGGGSLFPTPPFNATIWQIGVQPLASNAEIVTVTAISTDTLTIVRAQESSTARTIIIGDQIAATITTKTLTDLESGASYSFSANNTNAAANKTDQTFIDNAQQVYAGTVTWTGTTPPSGTTHHSYTWTQVGKMVSLRLNLWYTVAGTALTQVAIPLPTDCPLPYAPTGYAVGDYMLTGAGFLNTSAAGVPGASARVVLRNSAGYPIYIAVGSANYIHGSLFITYWTT